MLYERKQNRELYFLKHRHDSESANFDYEKDILNKSLSPYMFNNTMMSNFINYLQSLVSLLFDNFNIIKNFKNYIIDKNDYRQKG